MSLSNFEFKTKLSPLGLKIEDKIIKKCLEVFAKKKPVSPKAMSSLTRVFNVCKLTDQQVVKHEATNNCSALGSLT